MTRWMMRVVALLTICASLAGAGPCADVSLVLAIDSSSSIDPAEYRLQAQGYAAALVAPRVRRAIDQAGSVEVGVLFWGGAGRHEALPFRSVSDPADAEALASALARHLRRVSGETALGEGMGLALAMLGPRCASRRVINLSGDGRESAEGKVRSLRVAQARALAEAMGVSINGLAIETSDLGLGDYYRATVAAGPGAFTLSVRSFDALADALVEKLEREVRPPLVATGDPSPMPAGRRSGT